MSSPETNAPAGTTQIVAAQEAETQDDVAALSAKLDAADAIRAAVAAHPGKPTEVQFEQINGRGVYDVTVSGRHIGVDATSASIVALAESGAGDGDGETNDDGQ